MGAISDCCAETDWREAQLVSTDHFRQGLLAQMGRATKGGRIDILINSGELYRSLGGYPGSLHGMPSCCDAMQDEMKLGDTLLVDRTNGAGMTVRYLLPRSQASDANVKM
jgi:5-methylcytosine-specific restriction protein A